MVAIVTAEISIGVIWVIVFQIYREYILMSREVKKMDEPQSIENLRYLINNVLFSICRINKESVLSDVCGMLTNYENDCYYKENLPCEYSSQVGRVWILVGIIESEVTSITVGQSLEMISEIRKIIQSIFSKEDQGEKAIYYRNLLSEFTYIEFYEVPIDTYIQREFGDIDNTSGIVKVMFDLSKEYLVEASIAYKTGARDWAFYNSGMDKRSHIFIKDNEIERYKAIEKSTEGRMSKNTFEIHNETIMITRPEWDFVATATVRADYVDEIQSVTWGLNNNRYPYNAKLGTLHSYIMKKWYGEDLCNAMKAKDFVIDHMDNVSHNCCINNLCFLSSAWNKAKGYTLDQDSADKRYIALNMFKDFETKLFQITIQFNYPAKLILNGLEKPSVVGLAYLLYEGDYKNVISEAQSILNDYITSYEFKPEKLRAIDYHIEGEVGIPVELQVYEEYLNGKHGHGICYFDRRAPKKGWTKDTNEKFFRITDSEKHEYIVVTLES